MPLRIRCSILDDNGDDLSRKTEFLACFIQDGIVTWRFCDGASKATATRLDFAIWGKVLIIMHAVVKASSNAISSHDHIVSIEVVLMSFDRCRHPKGMTHIGIHVVVVMVVVATKVILHCLTTVNQEVVMS